MNQKIRIDDFLEQCREIPFFDVRTPAEFEKGHIPGAKNLPLFSNEERAVVGTIYKKQGKEKAVLKGLEFVGPKLADFIKEVKKQTSSKQIMLYCWRGGMRSASMAWLFETAGYSCSTLVGGYKSYRRKILNTLSKPANIIVLGGMTGSGKTEILHQLQKEGQQVLDLEGLANHKGSAFGWIGEDAQPSTEQFGNMILWEWLKFDPDQIIWIEDESHSVGHCFIPEELWVQMRNAPLLSVEVALENRIQRLIKDYTVEDKEALVQSTQKIMKRLGPQNVKLAVELIEEGNYYEATKIILSYYDKAYKMGQNSRDQSRRFYFNYQSNLMELISKAQEIADQFYQ